MLIWWFVASVLRNVRFSHIRILTIVFLFYRFQLFLRLLLLVRVLDLFFHRLLLVACRVMLCVSLLGLIMSLHVILLNVTGFVLPSLLLPLYFVVGILILPNFLLILFSVLVLEFLFSAILLLALEVGCLFRLFRTGLCLLWLVCAHLCVIPLLVTGFGFLRRLILHFLHIFIFSHIISSFQVIYILLDSLRDGWWHRGELRRYFGK